MAAARPSSLAKVYKPIHVTSQIKNVTSQTKTNQHTFGTCTPCASHPLGTETHNARLQTVSHSLSNLLQRYSMAEMYLLLLLLRGEEGCC